MRNNATIEPPPAPPATSEGDGGNCRMKITLYKNRVIIANDGPLPESFFRLVPQLQLLGSIVAGIQIEIVDARETE